MQNEKGQIIIMRFFEAIQRLKTYGIIGGKTPFCEHYGINRRNLSQMEKNMAKDIFKLEWLEILATDFNISPEWLITGRGDFFRKAGTIKSPIAKKTHPN